MRTLRRALRSEPGISPGPELQPRLARALVLALLLGGSACGSAAQTGESPEEGGEGGSPQSGRGGSGGRKTDAGSGGKGGGGMVGMDAAPEEPDMAVADMAASQGGSGGGAEPDMGASSQPDMAGADTSASPADGPPVTTRPDAMGAACATGMNYNFTIRPIGSAQTGTFTAYFDATPGAMPTNSVIGLSDGMKFIHDDFAVLIRFGASGMLDARNGATYSSATPIMYKMVVHHFRLVVNVPAHSYSAYVSYDGMPEVTIGTNLAFRDSAGVPTKFDYWGVESIAPYMTKVCGFLVQ